MTSNKRRYEADHRLFVAWSYPPGTPVIVKRANGATLRTHTTSPAFMGEVGAYVTVEGIPGNTALRRVSIQRAAARIQAAGVKR